MHVSPIRLSVIVPVLNEAANIESTLAVLQPMRQDGHEIIVVDGGSNDDTVRLSAPLADRVLQSRCGRATQMQAGAVSACGDIFWFLHADTRPPGDAASFIIQSLQDSHHGWGHFDVRFPQPGIVLRIVAAFMNLRSRLTRIATGDQGIFVTRALFEQVNGFQDIPLMEDIALSRAMKKHSRPVCIRKFLTTSARRWRRHGVLRTILLMWSLRLAYFLGVSPVRLARFYAAHRS